MRVIARQIAVTVAVAAGLMGIGAAPAPAQDPETVPPVSVSPANGAHLPAGRAVTFTVRSFPGDEYLWVHVSRSPEEVASCGTIGEDVDFESFDSTSTPGLFTATVDADEFHTPGTYYWQAHRISFADDADGCVEGPVRSFRYGNIPARRPGRYTGRTTQGRAVTFRLDASRMRVVYLNTSIRLSCSNGTLTTRLGFRNMNVRRDATFAQSLSATTFTQTATVKGRFRSSTRATGTVSSRASMPGAGRCGFRRVSWTAHRTGS